MASVDHRSLPAAADRRDDVPHATLQFRSQLDAECPGRIANISEACGTVTVDRSKEQQICSNLDTVTLVHSPATPGRLELERHEDSSISEILLENVVRLAAKPEARVAKHDRGDDAGVGGDNPGSAIACRSKSGCAAIPPKDGQPQPSKSRDYPGEDQEDDAQAYHGHLRDRESLAACQKCENQQHSSQDKKSDRPDHEATVGPLNCADAGAVLVMQRCSF